jgi:signal transduction histidine kinase/CheY-like chemotaxis protein
MDCFDTDFRIFVSRFIDMDSYEDTVSAVKINGKLRYLHVIVQKLRGAESGKYITISDRTEIMEARIAAEASNKAKGAFLATMSHEIRTPLNAIIGLSEVELNKELPIDSVSNIEKIYNSGSILLNIINDILDISKIEAGSLEIIPVRYEMPSLINDSVQLNIVRIGSKPITFKLSVDPDIPHFLYGDELRVKQILNNLLSNAIKYTDAGSVMLNVLWNKDSAFLSNSENEGSLSIIVHDTGRGIKAENLSQLFNEYSQLDTIKNRKIEGTGLGLAITKNLVEIMGGVINVESSYGNGSTFSVVIIQGISGEQVIGKQVAKDLETLQYNDNSHHRANIVRKPMPYGKVLIVDDVETNLDVAKGLLLPYKLQIDTASSGKEAIHMLQYGDTKYDLVFMDHMMPEMDGVEAVRIIRSVIPPGADFKYLKTVPIVALTANAVIGTEDMFLSNGFNGFISKPIDIMRLDGILNRYMRAIPIGNSVIRNSVPSSTEAEKQESNDIPYEFPNDIIEVNFNEKVNIFGSKRVYLSILKSFYHSTPSSLSILRSIIEKRTGETISKELLENYAITVHGIKGTARSIGADVFGNAAYELESASKNGDTDFVFAKSPAFFIQAEKLLHILEKVIADADATIAKPVKDEPDKTLLSEIASATISYNIEKIELIMEELESYKYKKNAELIVWLRKQIDMTEFSAINQYLSEFLQLQPEITP